MMIMMMGLWMLVMLLAWSLLKRSRLKKSEVDDCSAVATLYWRERERFGQLRGGLPVVLSWSWSATVYGFEVVVR